jgi:hypothetical protein
MILKNNRFNSGYDSEELYFEKLNRELIQKLKTGEGSGGQQDQHASPQSKQGEGAQILAFPQRKKETQKKAA